MIARDVIQEMNRLAPPYLKEGWDNTGFHLGRPTKEVSKVMLALDATMEVIEEAIEKEVDMIITHHPLIFHPIKEINADTTRGKMLYHLIKKDIVVFSAHTNLDAAKGGVNDVLAEKLEIHETEVLRVERVEKFLKLVVFVPKDHAEDVRTAITEAGAGHIGQYSHCTYNSQGKGTFMPREGSQPFIGTKNKLEWVDETRIETIIKKKDLEKTLEKMFASHPYEEVAYDIYPLENSEAEYGLGRIGLLEAPTTLGAYAKKVKQLLNCDSIRLYGDVDRQVQRIAVVGGSGAEFMTDAYHKGADLFITGDIRSFEAMDAKELNLPLIDADHYPTERVVLPALKTYLEDRLKEKGRLEIMLSDQDNNAPSITL